MKKADMILAVSVIGLCLILFWARSAFQKQGAFAVVEIDGEHYGTYELGRDGKIEIGSGNCIAIEDGKVWMLRADCPDQLCVRQGKISRDGEMIVCLPNRVTVQVSDEGSTDVVPDAIAG